MLLSSILDLDFRILDLDLNVKFSLVLACFQFKQKSPHELKKMNWLQSHFDYACPACYPNLDKTLIQNYKHSKKFFLNLKKDCFKQCFSSTTFKFFNNKSAGYMNDAF